MPIDTHLATYLVISSSLSPPDDEPLIHLQCSITLDRHHAVIHNTKFGNIRMKITFVNKFIATILIDPQLSAKWLQQCGSHVANYKLKHLNLAADRQSVLNL